MARYIVEVKEAPSGIIGAIVFVAILMLFIGFGS